MYLQSYAEIFELYCWMAGSSTWFFITPLLGWTCNVFFPSDHPSDLTHQGASVTADFTTHGGSHIYGLACPSTDSFDPMDHFCTFDVSKIIPKNMHYFPYMTFKPILAYIRGYDHQTCVYRDVRKNPNSFGVFLDVDASHLSLGLPCPSIDSLDPMDHFFTFDVSKIIPKNMHYLLYVTFKPILA